MIHPRQMKKKITDLKIQKYNRQRVSVFLDGKYAFSLSSSAAMNLEKGCYLESARINQLLQKDEFPRCYNSAVRYLARRPRSINETRIFLTGRDYRPEIVQKTIDRLTEQNYLDDSAYARLWIENRMHFRPKSAFALRFELRQKGVADSVIENMLHDFDDDKAAWKALKGRLRRWQNLDRPQFKSKLFSFLKTRGFCYDTCCNALERARLDRDKND